MSCVTMLEIAPSEFEAVRANDRRFVVVPGHVDPEIEVVVEQRGGYVVVEKVDAAGEVAENAAS